jgi:hypothetical protein
MYRKFQSRGKFKTMALKRVTLLVLGLVLVSASMAGCGVSGPGATPQGAMRLIPQGANLIASIQVGKIINDPGLRNAYDTMEKDPGQPPTFEEALDALVEEIGIDLRDFSQAVVFADISTMEQADYIAVIAEGTFDEQQLIDDIQLRTGEKFTASDHRGYKIYSAEREDIAIAFLSDSMLVFGTMAAVRHTIDVSEGDREQVSGVLLDTYNGLGDALVKLAVELPEEVRGAFSEEMIPGDIPISLGLFADIDIFGFAFNKEAETIAIQVNAHFLSADSARDAGDALSGVISLFKGITEAPGLKELLGNIEVSVTDSNVIIAFEATISELEYLAETLQP